MRTLRTLTLLAVLLSLGGLAAAELQNVEVGGKLRIRGNYWNWDGGADASFVDQRSQLNVKANFTDEVSLFIEFDNYSVWGEDFRSLYLTGADGRGAGDVDLYQAYIDAKNLWGTPLSLRVGRQELVFGGEFLLGNNDTGPAFAGLSYDALRLTYAADTFSIDAFAAKLAETLGDFGQDDINLYGVYGSYTGIENTTLDAYYLYLQDDGVALGDDVDIHTAGLRGAGTLGAFNYDLNVAYQFGDTDITRRAGLFRRTDVDVDALGVHAVAGYTFDAAWQPHVFALFAYYEGGDDGELPFNRLFSDTQYSDFVDTQSNATNVIGYALGLQVAPTERVTLALVGKYLDRDENDGDWNEWGWEAGLSGTYNYSEDLAFSAGYSHFFRSDWNDGETPDFDYVFVQTEIAF